MSLSKKRQRELHILELTQAVFQTDKPSKNQVMLAGILDTVVKYMTERELTKLLLSDIQFVKIARRDYNPVNSGEVKAAVATMRPLLKKLATTSALFPNEIPIAIVPVNALAFVDKVAENQPVDTQEAKKYILTRGGLSYKGVYISTSINGTLPQAYIEIQRAKGVGLIETANQREEGWRPKGLLPNSQSLPLLES